MGSNYFNSIALSDLESQIREVLKRCLSYKIVEEVPVIKYQLETNCVFSYDKNGNIVPNPSKEWTGGDENGENDECISMQVCGFFGSIVFLWMMNIEIVALTDEEISLYIDKELVGKGIPIEAKNWNIKNEKEVPYPRTGVPVFMLKDVGIGFRTIEGATEVANLLVKYNAFKIESRFLTGSYEQFWIIKESVCPAIKGEAGYSKEEFDKVNKENQDPELESINSFNNTLKNANEIKDRVLKYVYNIKQERSYNNDLVGIFERYKDIADGDMEVAMNFIKEAYPFNEETESFIRKKFDMPMPDESKE